MALAKEQYPAADRILPASARSFLEDFQFGRWGIGAGRKIAQSLRSVQNPAQRKLWVRRRSLPLRNALLLNRPLTVFFGGIAVSLVPQGAVAAEIWIGLSGKKQQAAFLLSVLEPGMIFFDVGADAGLCAIPAAKKIGGRGVFAFEADPPAYDLLKRNVLLNRVGEVQAEKIALGDAARPETPRSTTVDAYMKQHDVPRVDAMRVDSQGAELFLFQGARNLLERADAPLIMYDCDGFLTRGFGYHPVEILWFLESCGYALYLLNRETGAISELKPDYQYDSMVVAAKPGSRAMAGVK